jgi:Xaa-Pro aminopeptidase
MFPAEIYHERRKELRSGIDNGLIVIFGNTECSRNYGANFYPFRQDSSFLYFFGLNVPDLVGVIDVDSGEEIIYGNEIELDDIIWMGKQSSLSEKCERVSVLATRPLKKLADDLKNSKTKHRRIHYLPPYSVQRRQQLACELNISHEEADKSYSEELVTEVIKLRSIKHPIEVEEIERTLSEITYLMYIGVMKLAKPGIFEHDIAGTIEGIALKNNCRMAFPVICTINGEILHNNYYGNKLKQGQLLLVDSGSESSKYYATDITRTIPVGGKFSDIQKEIYNIVLEAEEASIKLIKPGISYKSIHMNAAKIIASGLKESGLMHGDIDEAVSKGAHALFFPHGLGHMLGLDAHDMEDLGEDNVGYDNGIERSKQFGLSALRLAKKLEQGFVLTVEPGIYFIPALIERWKSEKKFTEHINYSMVESYIGFGGIRIEDDVLVTRDGSRVLGKPIPKTINNIENTARNK